jgi:elongator complex protein 5
MSDHNVLNTVLDGTQVPYQPFVVIVDSAVFSGLPLFRESLRRALNR